MSLSIRPELPLWSLALFLLAKRVPDNLIFSLHTKKIIVLKEVFFRQKFIIA
jgi:hypothetical protein